MACRLCYGAACRLCFFSSFSPLAPFAFAALTHPSRIGITKARITSYFAAGRRLHPPPPLCLCLFACAVLLLCRTRRRSAAHPGRRHPRGALTASAAAADICLPQPKRTVAAGSPFIYSTTVAPSLPLFSGSLCSASVRIGLTILESSRPFLQAQRRFHLALTLTNS
ncbi:hypothetical protein SEVIR_2G181101v4 [Setaria viridis]